MLKFILLISLWSSISFVCSYYFLSFFDKKTLKKIRNINEEKYGSILFLSLMICSPLLFLFSFLGLILIKILKKNPFKKFFTEMIKEIEENF